MAFKLAISNTIQTKVSGYNTDENGVHRKFDFTLAQERLDQDELKRSITDKSEDAVEIIRRITKGWNGQRLVMTEDDQPAPFSAEALDLLLSIAGMAGFCWQAYLVQVLAHEKN